MSSIFRSRAGPLIVLGTSALGGAAYRYARPPSSSNASLDPHTFTPYTLVDKQTVSPTSAIFTLRNQSGSPDPESVLEASKRSVWSVQIKQPQLQIARAYTPLPPTTPALSHKGSEAAPEDVRLLIRQEQGGEVSTYLHRLPEQATIELRGPNTECELPVDIKEVIFLAGGTGIAPAMQVAQALTRRTGSKMQILWANRLREECLGGISDEKEITTQSRTSWWKSLVGLGQKPELLTLADAHIIMSKGAIVQELDTLKERSQVQTRGLSVQYYVDEEKRFIKPSDVARRLQSLDSEEKGSRVIMVSGPDGFIEYWAGKKVWEGGRETQGPLGGVLKQMDLKDWSVIKL